MRKFIDSQVKSKDERATEKEASRLEREQRKTERRAIAEAERAKERERYGFHNHHHNNNNNDNMQRYSTGQSGGSVMPAGGIEFDTMAHKRRFGRRLANPAPLGLFAYSFSIFLLGLINIGAAGVNQPNAMVAPFLMYSAIMMAIAAIFELIAGNTFGATAFGTFGGFFLSLGGILLPSFGVFTDFAANPILIFKFLGIFFATWLIPFGIFVLLTMRSTWTLWLQFIMLFVTIALSCAQYLKNNNRTLQIISGGFSIASAAFGFLNGAAGLMHKETVFFTPKVLPMPWSSEAMVAGAKGPDHPHNEHNDRLYKMNI